MAVCFFLGVALLFHTRRLGCDVAFHLNAGCLCQRCFLHVRVWSRVSEQLGHNAVELIDAALDLILFPEDVRNLPLLQIKTNVELLYGKVGVRAIHWICDDWLWCCPVGLEFGHAWTEFWTGLYGCAGRSWV